MLDSETLGPVQDFAAIRTYERSPLKPRLSAIRYEFASARRRPPRAKAILISAVLSLLFVLVYGGCNELASRRTDVNTLFFAWELRVPFIPALVAPYMALDLFFVLSFLVCTDSKELATHARRIAAAILTAGAAFLLFPLQTGYGRPPVSGWPADLFALLWSFDKPHNLAPSLHVALASLLWPIYVRHTRPSLRWLVRAWFALIIVSSIFTWQHHVFDIVSGAMLGQVCMFAFPDKDKRETLVSSGANFRAAWLYAAGSATLAVLGIAAGSWLWLLLWPAASLALIAAAYVRGTSNVFRKSGGRIPISARIVLGPYLLGLSVRTLIRRLSGKRWVEAAPGVYQGGLLTKRQALEIRAMGISGVLDLTAEHSETGALLQIPYLNVPVLDLTEPSRDQLDRALRFIREHARLGGVYVHCALGVSRSVAITSAYLASNNAANLIELPRPDEPLRTNEGRLSSTA